MLGGSATVPPADAFSGVAFILNLAMRMTDPERRALREDIEKLIEAGRRAEHAIAELHHREQAQSFLLSPRHRYGRRCRIHGEQLDRAVRHHCSGSGAGRLRLCRSIVKTSRKFPDRHAKCPATPVGQRARAFALGPRKPKADSFLTRRAASRPHVGYHPRFFRGAALLGVARISLCCVPTPWCERAGSPSRCSAARIERA